VSGEAVGRGIGVVCYPSLGGSGIVATDLACGLARRGHRVHLIASAAPSRNLAACSLLRLHEVSAPDYPLFDQPPAMLAMATAIAEVATSERLDLIHVHYAVPHAASAYLARQLLGDSAPRLVTTLHGTDVTHLGSLPSYRALTRFCVEASDAITVPSAYLQAEAHRLLGISTARSIEIIRNGVDSQHFASAAPRDPAHFARLFGPNGSNAPVLFHVSNFRPVKRVVDLFEVLARVRQRIPARLVLVGDGPERAAAVRRSQELGLEDSVRFLGSQVDFSEHLRHAAAFLSTSESESFGLAALEALSCGVPVLGYRVGGLPSLVNDDVGRLVEAFDLAALADATVALLTNPALRDRMAAAARARALTEFQLEPVLARYEALYERVLLQNKVLS
jgi:N-acetyl-alpha-D-glucosaminyl L-malate synthase BshA